MLRKRLVAAACWLLAGTALTACTSVPDPPKGLQVALVVDTSGSMALDGRLQGLQKGALGFVDVLQDRWNETSPDGDQAELWLSLVPYSGRVNLRDHSAFFEAAPVNPDLACPDPRDGVLGQDDSPLSQGRLPNARLAHSFMHLKRYLCPAVAMVGPTRDLDEIRRALSDLKPQNGCTRFDLATIWGWRAVSPRWWPAWHGDLDADPKPPRASARAVIVMTDGWNTPRCTRDQLSREQADAQFLNACAAMRQQGIRVYTLYLGEVREGLQKTLGKCAGVPGRARHAPNAEALLELFVQLAEEVAALRPEA